MERITEKNKHDFLRLFNKTAIFLQFHYPEMYF